MLDFASAVKRSANYKARLAALERASAASPDDRGLRITLASAKRSADRAEKELFDVAQRSDVEICRYKVAKTDEQLYSASRFADSLTAYQDLFTALYDFVKNGPKTTASYTRDIRESSALNIGYTYPGSLGVLLTVAGEDRDLFGHGELDRVVAQLVRLSEIDSINDVKSIADELGLNVVRRTSNWAKQNWAAGYSVDVQWTHSNAHIRGEFIQRDRFLKIQSLIEQTSDVETDKLEVIGTLGTYSILSDIFAVLTPNGDTYRGKLSDEFDRREYKIPAQYRATMQVERSTKYATETTTETYFLLSLEDA